MNSIVIVNKDKKLTSNETQTESFFLNSHQQLLLEQLTHSLNARQIDWMSGYFAGKAAGTVQLKKEPLASNQFSNIQFDAETASKPKLSILYGSRTGNGAQIAKKAQKRAEGSGFAVTLIDLNDYKANSIKQETNILLIVSTHGEGVPPTAAEDLYNYLHGKKASSLAQLQYSVLALGDSSYVYFCKVGKDFDVKLEELGAKRIYERTDCDVDFEDDADAWIEASIAAFAKQTDAKSSPAKKEKTNTNTVVTYNKKNPWEAPILEKIQLNGSGSEKETYHLELSLEGSGLVYEPGDSVGIFLANSQRLVDEFLSISGLFSKDIVEFDSQKTTLGDALLHSFELSTISIDTLKRFNVLAQSDKLQKAIDNPDYFKELSYGHDIVDLLAEFPIDISSQQVVEVLRRLQPRLYSISSSQKAHPDEVHITVSAVRYTNSRYKEGACSTFLADRITDDSTIKIFIEKNPEFRLPVNKEKAIIMIGPGTGVAPFRSFVEERAETGATGKNWLIFGDRHFATDFLYQTEWQDFVKKGKLSKLSVAFSRDTNQKIYVQHKMLEHSKELYAWIKDGAHFYVCGDMKHMWNDVNRTLLQVLQQEGKFNEEEAEEYLRDMKKQKRYQVDVY